MKKYEIVIEYLKLEKESPIGTSRLAPLIFMINRDEKIVEELLDKDFIHYNSLLSFLDYGVRHLINNSTTDYDLETTYKIITFVLNTFNKLENKWEIRSEEFINILESQWV